MTFLFRMMMVAMIGLFLVFVTNVAFAQEIDLNSLTPAQKAELVIQAEKMKTQVKTTSPADLAEYAELGQKYGIAIANVAKELGKSIDEIMDTNVGKIALVLIVWKVAGDTLLGLVAGSTWFAVMLSLWAYYFNRLVLRMRVRAVTETFDETTGKLKSRVSTPGAFTDDVAGTAIIMAFFLVIICISGFIIMF